MDLRDVRRLAATILVLAVLVLAWLVLLALQAAGRAEAAWPARALEALPLRTWMWAGAGVLLALLAFLAATVFAAGVLPPGWAQGSVRQVQCDHCKAVFLLLDTGHRPITHRCPNCRFLGIYDGQAAPAGKAHKTVGRTDVVRLALRCRACSDRFEVTDTGVRPMRIECPRCEAVGALR